MGDENKPQNFNQDVLSFDQLTEESRLQCKFVWAIIKLFNSPFFLLFNVKLNSSVGFSNEDLFFIF